MRRPRNESRLKIKIRTFILTHPIIPYKTLSGHFLTKDALRIMICCIYDIDDAVYHGYESNTTHLDAYLGEEKCSKPMTHIEMYLALQYLEKLGLVHNLYGDKDNFRFNATYECLHYFQLKRKSLVYNFLHSIALPIIISVITTLVVMYFTAKLQVQ